MIRPVRIAATVAGCLLFANASLYAASDTIVKGTTADNSAAALEATNSSDVSLLFVRNDGNVGIGDSTPTAALTVGTDKFLVASTGNVSIVDGVLVDLSAVNASATTEGLKLPQANGVTAATAEGQLSWDSTKDYATIGTNGGQVALGSTQYSIVAAANFSLATSTGVQSAFATTGDVWTLPANTTFLMDGLYNITRSGNSATTAMAFASGGSITSIKYWADGQTATGNNATGTAQSSALVDQIASTVVLATGTSGGWIRFHGIVRTNGSGTFTPQVNFSATTTSPVMLAGSYITLQAVGTDTANVLGNVA